MTWPPVPGSPYALTLPPEPMRPVYPLAAFFSREQNAINEVQICSQAPLAMVAMSFLSTMAIACQALWTLRLPFGGSCPLSLNTLVFCDSGERKSAVDKLVAAAIYADDRRLKELHSVNLQTYKIEFRNWKKAGQRLNRQIDMLAPGIEQNKLILKQLEHEGREPAEPRLRRMMFEDASGAAILEALDGNDESIGLYAVSCGTQQSHCAPAVANG